MKNYLYPETMLRVKTACEEFLAEKLGISGLQAMLHRSEQEIEALEEKWLRTLLFDIENQIEEVIYTTASNQQHQIVATLVQALLEKMFEGVEFED